MSGYEKALRYSPPLDPYLTGLVKLESVRESVYLLNIMQIDDCQVSDIPVH